jgi:hypothetical protein
MPCFSTLDRFRPRTAAVIHGVVLTAALFIVTCYAIPYSWIRVLDMRIPALEFEGSPSVHPSASPSELRGRSGSESQKKGKPPASESETSSAHLYVEPLPVEAEGTAETKVERPDTKTFNSSLGAPVPVSGSLENRLRSYAGTYLSRSPRITISIEIRDGELVMKREGLSERTLSPLSQTTFLVEGSENSEVVFASESDGKFRRLELFEPGRQITALRR